MPDVPTKEEKSTVETITDGYFEEEYYVSAESAGDFLIQLGEQLQTEDEVTITGDGWKIPFAFGGPVELEVEFEGGSEPELEIEVELSGRIEDETPGVD